MHSSPMPSIPWSAHFFGRPGYNFFMSAMNHMDVRKMNLAILCGFYVALHISACSTGPSETYMAYLRSPQGLLEWQREDKALEQKVGIAEQQYQRDASIQALRAYEKAVRSHLDHGFSLYRSYSLSTRKAPIDDLVPSLERREARLMDVANEYIKQGGTRLAEGIAEDLVHKYDDLPETSRVRQRAEALLFHYRYSKE